MNFYQKSIKEIINFLPSSLEGLTSEQVFEQRKKYGANTFPKQKTLPFIIIFFKQFLGPLIYVLLSAAFVSIFLGHTTDAIFIFFVLFLNALIGSIQEYSAEKNSISLLKIVPHKTLVKRENQLSEIRSEELVPGDIIFLKSGEKVPADARLIETSSLIIDESLLTGESNPVSKNSETLLKDSVPLGDQLNMIFSGTTVISGKGKAVVCKTGLNTELGKIAEFLKGPSNQTPLTIRMEKFSKKISLFTLIIIFFLATTFYLRGTPIGEIFMLSVALSVAAIPEGLPIAITIALSIASRRMSKKNVIVKNLPAVEALGSCNYIATDKTGTLTLNELTVTYLLFPNESPWEVTGVGLNPEGKINIDSNCSFNKANFLTTDLILHSCLCNDANLVLENQSWKGSGDSTDLAILVLGHKGKILKSDLEKEYQRIKEIPYESDRKFQGTLHKKNVNNEHLISIKGSVEVILPMCELMNTTDGQIKINANDILKQSEELCSKGLRVLAIAGKKSSEKLSLESLTGLTFLGLMAMIDPLRQETREAISKAQKAGIKISVITGDHPITSFSIAKELGLVSSFQEVVTGQDLSKEKNFNLLVNQTHIFSRVDPSQKLKIVQSLMESGHYVAVTGDGANDSPALRHANVGISMGLRGSDIAIENSDLILTDDNFSSIVSGIEEGRIAYSNIRKVIYLLISTGVAEVLIFVLSTLLNLPMPLTAIQVLWMNLVTNGIQDVALAFEGAEGDELLSPPRAPNEPIFDRIMIRRVLISAMTMGGVSIVLFSFLLNKNYSLFDARNMVLLLMVLFENVMIGNCRSEKKSAFKIALFKNPFLLIGTLLAQGLHITAMHLPFFANILKIQPVSFNEWIILLILSLSVLLIIEVDKFIVNFKK